MRTLTVSLFLWATAAAAGSLGDVCGHLIGSQTTDCLSAGNGKFISPVAVDECGKLIGGQVVGCIKAIAGKDYSHDDAAACGKLIGGQVVDCFARTGRVHAQQQPPDDAAPTNAEVRAELAAAIEQLHANDVPGADARLRRLLHRLR
jgi:hypothetical protein